MTSAYPVAGSESRRVPGRHPVVRRCLEEFAVVVLAHDAAVDQRVAVAGHQLYVTRAAGEALEVVHAVLSPHHQLAGRDLLAARRAGPARPE